MTVELRWVVPEGTTTAAPRLQYRNWGEWPAVPADPWQDVPTVVVPQEPPKPAPTALIAPDVPARSNDLTHRQISTAIWEVPQMPWVLRDGQTVTARDLGLYDLAQPGYDTLRDLTVHQVLDVLRQRNGGVNPSDGGQR